MTGVSHSAALAGYAAGGARVTHLDNRYKATGGDVNSYTFSGVDFGPAYSGRALIGAVTMVNGSLPGPARLGSATIAGDAAAVLYDPADTSAVRGSFFGVFNDAATSGDIVVTKTGTDQFARAALTLYAVEKLKSLTPVDSDCIASNAAIGRRELTLTTSRGGVILALSMSTVSVVWSGLVEDTDDGSWHTTLDFSTASRSRLPGGDLLFGMEDGASISAISLR